VVSTNASHMCTVCRYTFTRADLCQPCRLPYVMQQSEDSESSLDPFPLATHLKHSLPFPITDTIVYQLAFLTPGNDPASAFILKLYCTIRVSQ
jgi:hypothetical protein